MDKYPSVVLKPGYQVLMQYWEIGWTGISLNYHHTDEAWVLDIFPRRACPKMLDFELWNKR